MAAVTLKEGEDFECSDAYNKVVNYLPAYARPRFVRIQVMLTVHLYDHIFYTLSFTIALLPCPPPWPTIVSICVLQPCLEMTGTFKMKKVKLVEEGFNPALIKDALYFLQPEKKTYVPLTEDIYKAIISREIKL